MSEQLDFLRMRRNTDPAPSHEAATRHALEALSERRLQVYALVRKFPGSTQGELAHHMLAEYKLPINTCAATPHKRLPELERLGLVKRGAKRKCLDSSYQSATWWAV